MTFQVQPDPFGGATSVLFDDASNSIVIAAPQSFQLALTPPSGATQTYQSTATSMALPLTGPLAGAATLTFPLDETALAQLEAGMIYFAPVAGGLVSALRYPAFRAAAGQTAPFNLSLSLDILAPLDAERTFFQFTDPLIGSYSWRHRKTLRLPERRRVGYRQGEPPRAGQPAGVGTHRCRLLLSDARRPVRAGARRRPGDRPGDRRGRDGAHRRAAALRRHRDRISARRRRGDTRCAGVRARPGRLAAPGRPGLHQPGLSRHIGHHGLGPDRHHERGLCGSQVAPVQPALGRWRPKPRPRGSSSTSSGSIRPLPGSQAKVRPRRRRWCPMQG